MEELIEDLTIDDEFSGGAPHASTRPISAVLRPC